MFKNHNQGFDVFEYNRREFERSTKRNACVYWAFIALSVLGAIIAIALFV